MQQHYPTLGFTQFRIVESIPSNIRLPPEVDELLMTPLPAAYDFSLEEKIITDFEATQAASTKLTDNGAPESKPAKEEPQTPPVGGNAAPAKPPKPISSPTGTANPPAVDDKRAKVLRMKELTNADDATCTFYLESWGWNLERAVQEYFNK